MKTQLRRMLLVLVTGAGVAACDSGTEPAVPATIEIAGDATIPVAAGANAQTLSVTVETAQGEPVAGVSVAWQVTSGTAELSAPTSTTDQTGVARTQVTPDTVVGTTTVLASVAGLSTVSFTIEVGPAAPAAITKVAGDDQSAMVGVPVAEAPAVRVVDRYGNPVPGVSVAWQVTGGSAELSAGTSTTDQTGIARTQVTPGTAVGMMTVVAGVAGLSTVSFTIEVGPAAPASITKVAGDDQNAMAGMPVAEAPAVRVADRYGNPVPGVAVSFTPSDGSGVVAAATDTTDALGVASSGGWTLGSAPGTASLTATVAGVPPITFTATALDPCKTHATVEIGTSWEGGLSSTDCVLANGRRADYYAFTADRQTMFQVTFTSDDYRATVGVLSASGALVVIYALPAAGDTLAYKVILPAGDYVIRASSATMDMGSYEITTTRDADVACQPWNFVLPGITTEQEVKADDCAYTHYFDRYWMFLTAGQTVRIAVDAAFEAAIEMYDADNQSAAREFDAAGHPRMTYTAPKNGYYHVAVVAGPLGNTGSYTFSFENVGAAAVSSYKGHFPELTGR